MALFFIRKSIELDHLPQIQIRSLCTLSVLVCWLEASHDLAGLHFNVRQTTGAWPMNPEVFQLLLCIQFTV